MEFVSPYSLLECAGRIETLDKGMPAISARTVKVRRLDENSYEFRIVRWFVFSSVANVQGKLIFSDNQCTHVVVTGKLGIYLRRLLLIYTALCVLIVVLDVANHRTEILFGGIAALGWGFIVWLVWAQFPKHLARSVKSVLT